MTPTLVATSLLVLLCVTAVMAEPGRYIGPSTTTKPYLVPMQKGVNIWSILTVGDSVPNTSDPSTNVTLAGIPDGMGAYLLDDTPDLEYTPSCRPVLKPHYAASASETFTLLVNHELGGSSGAVRRHGARGAFVSKWTIDRQSLRVVSGEDLIEKVALYNPATGTYSAPTTGVTFGRFCAADLPAISAFYDKDSGKGTRDRIFMNGEEIGPEGRAFAHVATGADKGISYQLPRLGRASWENQVASPHSGEKTVVIGLDDSGGGQVYVYIGIKQSTGSVVDKAGLTNGRLYGINVLEFNGVEPSAAAALPTKGPLAFRLEELGDVSNWSGAQLEGASTAKRVTRFARPEDGGWAPVDSGDGKATFYFVTTASFTENTRLWKVEFADKTNPLAGGVITAVVDGQGARMLDNLVATCDSSVILQEDPGSPAYLGRMWRYNAKDGLIALAEHTPDFFLPGEPAFLTSNEESSGSISAAGLVINKPGQCFLIVTQAHYGIPASVDPSLVEGGQLMLMCVLESLVNTYEPRP